VTGIRKFIVPLPGLGPTGIPVLTADPTMFPGFDTYSVMAGQFSQQLHPALPATQFFGYADASSPNFRYLGGVIVAKSNTPVKLRILNRLPAAHILPVDATLIDPVVAAETGGRTDRIAVHLHGGFVFWDSDGGPFSWFSNSNNPGGFVHGSSFTIPAGAPGGAIYTYPNNQSARFLWYHDHAYSLTRTNVFAGLASAYLITDDAEAELVKDEVIPAPSLGGTEYPLGIPLIIQDKTFWDGPGGHDPGYGSVPPAGASVGSLWYPYVYEGDLDANLPSMLLPLTSSNTARWGANPPGAAPPLSSVPEYFSDTILVNGAPYPTVTVPPRRFRFRFLNASQGRFYNLQLYVADGVPDGITLGNTGELDNNDNPILKPTNPAGPAFIQIGNEAGFLPAPVVFSADGTSNINSNHAMGYKLGSNLPPTFADAGRYARVGNDTIRLSVVSGDPTIGNANRYNLLMAPAERPDVIIDFRGFENQKLILYNDAPAPFPGGDIRNDYYVGNVNLTSIGGAPPTMPGFGPDTRVLMQFVVGSSGGVSEPDFADTVTMLRNSLRVTFNETQPSTSIVPPSASGVKTKSLIEDNDPFGRLRQLLGSDASGNSLTFLDTPMDVASQGEIQWWRIFNLTGDTHPMHFHLVNVSVIRREQWAFDSSGNPILPLQIIPGTQRLPDLNEMGWKETVMMHPGEVTTVAMQFNLPAGTPPPPSPRLASYNITGAEYVWHCHILEHEEHDMMHALVVI